MSTYLCDVCGTPHRFPFSAALCCDVLTNELDTVDPGPTVTLGYD